MQFPGSEHERRQRLLEKIAEAAHIGIDFVQLREKDLCSRDLELLAREAVNGIHAATGRTRLLINSRTDIALTAGADGVHLRSSDISPEDVRKIWRDANGPGKPIIAVSCHTDMEVIAARDAGADFAVFGPVFEKAGAPEMGAWGLDLLRSACRHKIPVVALGGTTPENAHLCIKAGAGGIAGIRLFQKSNIAASVAKLRG